MKDIDSSNATKTNENWLSSKDAMKALKISACELMHKREAGKLEFKKKGNAFFYKIKSN